MGNPDILVKARLGGPRCESAQALIQALASTLAENPRALEAYLFGSFARGNNHPHSDVDLIIVAETDRPFIERYLDFTDLFDLAPDLDLLIYTKAEIARLRKDPSPGFWRSVWQEAKKLEF